MERHRNMLESMAERIRAMKMELKGTLYSQVRASFDVLAFQLQQRAVSCGEISDAVARICRNYKDNKNLS